MDNRYIRRHSTLVIIREMQINLTLTGWLSPKRAPRWLSGKKSAYQCRRCGFDPWVRKTPWKRKWQSTTVFSSGKSHGHRNLAGYSSWDSKESDTTYQLSTDTVIKYYKLSDLEYRFIFSHLHRLGLKVKFLAGLVSSETSCPAPF